MPGMYVNISTYALLKYEPIIVYNITKVKAM